jgi:hypothetical protein
VAVVVVLAWVKQEVMQQKVGICLFDVGLQIETHHVPPNSKYFTSYELIVLCHLALCRPAEQVMLD